MLVARQLREQNDVLALVNGGLNEQLSSALSALQQSKVAQKRLLGEKKGLESRALSAEALVHKLTTAFQIKEAQLSQAERALAATERACLEAEMARDAADAARDAADAARATAEARCVNSSVQRDAAQAKLMARISEVAAVATTAPPPAPPPKPVETPRAAAHLLATQKLAAALANSLNELAAMASAGALDRSSADLGSEMVRAAGSLARSMEDCVPSGPPAAPPSPEALTFASAMASRVADLAALDGKGVSRVRRSPPIDISPRDEVRPSPLKRPRVERSAVNRAAAQAISNVLAVYSAAYPDEDPIPARPPAQSAPRSRAAPAARAAAEARGRSPPTYALPRLGSMEHFEKSTAARTLQSGARGKVGRQAAAQRAADAKARGAGLAPRPDSPLPSYALPRLGSMEHFEKSAAARTLQSGARGKVGRQEAAQRAANAKARAAAPPVTQERLPPLYALPRLGSMEHFEKSAAARTLQSGARGKVGRQEAAQRAANAKARAAAPPAAPPSGYTAPRIGSMDYAEQSAAALSVQANMRGRAARKEAAAKKRTAEAAAAAAEKAVAEASQAEAEAEEAKEHAAACAMQARARGVAARKAAAFDLDAAMLEQAEKEAEEAVAEAEAAAKASAAAAVQARARGYLARQASAARAAASANAAAAEAEADEFEAAAAALATRAVERAVAARDAAADEAFDVDDDDV